MKFILKSFTRPFIGTALSALIVCSIVGCKSNSAPIASGVDPAAAANLAPVSGSQNTQVLGTSSAYTPQQQSESYNGEQQDTAYEQEQAPPPLRSYEQPSSPGRNYIWTPGYWGSGPSGYVWVNGTWSRPPYTGALWTPPYWAYTNNRYRLHQGYWGRHVGYYGGVDYGYGYIGTGYYGGYWRNNDFLYNRSVNRIGRDIDDNYVYDRPVVYNNIHYGYAPHVTVSFNGGPGGIAYTPRDYEVVAMREQHQPAYGVQVQNWRQAGGAYVVNNHVQDVHERNFDRKQDKFDNGHDNGNHGDHGNGDHGGDHGHGHDHN